MSDDRKKPIWPWITALLIGLPVLYVALFGPACWICGRAPESYTLWNATGSFYSPILRVWWRNFPGTTSNTIAWYANLGARIEITVSETSDGDVCLVQAVP